MITETPADRCDRCGAPAKTMAVLTSGGELLFCNHHARIHRAALTKVALWIEDTIEARSAPFPEPAPIRRRR